MLTVLSLLIILGSVLVLLLPPLLVSKLNLSEVNANAVAFIVQSVNFVCAILVFFACK